MKTQFLNQKASSSFWVPEDGSSESFTIYSPDGSISLKNCSDPQIIDPFSIGERHDSQFFLCDQNLNLQYSGNDESGDTVIDDAAPVRKNVQCILAVMSE